jgi:alkylation response protein AidB-like acyl-CoA dehydrogenase
MSPFCETFFNNARALKKNVVGEVNKGWTVAKRLLQYERTSIGGIGGGTQASTKIEDIAKTYVGDADGRIADDATRQRVIAHRMNDRSFGLTMRRSMEESQSGRAPGAASSMFKYYGTEQNIRKYELLLSIMVFQLCCVLPLFVLGWDFGRWIFLWTASSVVVFLAVVPRFAPLVAGARFLDLFAGSGAVGIEAWSRDAASVCWVESHPRVLPVLKQNVIDLCGSDAGVVRADVRVRGGVIVEVGLDLAPQGEV